MQSYYNTNVPIRSQYLFMSVNVIWIIILAATEYYTVQMYYNYPTIGGIFGLLSAFYIFLKAVRIHPFMNIVNLPNNFSKMKLI